MTKAQQKLEMELQFSHCRKRRQWEHLVITNNDKDKLREIRYRALLKAQIKLAAESKAKATKTQEERKYALETMMMLEEEGRARIQKMKDDEYEKATAELEAWKLKQGQIAEGEAQPKLQSQRIKVDKQSKSEKIHVPRTSDRCKVKHALRESRVPEEEEWLQKQAEARRAINADLAELKDLTEEERNPDWLKENNKLFATGNYLAAINTYSLAMKLNRKIPAIYSSRAACHLKLRNLHKAIEDSSWIVIGLQDYQAALKIDPQNEALQSDTQN